MNFTTANFTTKDSGKREEFTSGMVRDTQEGKPNFALVYDGPMLERWAALLTRGAVKYAKRNWMKATGEAELERFKESAARHFAQWMRGDSDEDHAAAVMFNLNGAEYVRLNETAQCSYCEGWFPHDPCHYGYAAIHTCVEPKLDFTNDNAQADSIKRLQNLDGIGEDDDLETEPEIVAKEGIFGKPAATVYPSDALGRPTPSGLSGSSPQGDGDDGAWLSEKPTDGCYCSVCEDARDIIYIRSTNPNV